MRYYEVSLPAHLRGLPRDAQRARLLRCWMGASLSPTDIRLVFTPRHAPL